MPPVAIPEIQPWEQCWGHPGSGVGAGRGTGHVPSLSLQWPHAAAPALGSKDAATSMSVPGASCSHCDVPSGVPLSLGPARVAGTQPRATMVSAYVCGVTLGPARVSPQPSHHGVTLGSRDVVSLTLPLRCLLSPVTTLSPLYPRCPHRPRGCPQSRRPRCRGNTPAAPPAVSMAAAALPGRHPAAGNAS